MNYFLQIFIPMKTSINKERSWTKGNRGKILIENYKKYAQRFHKKEFSEIESIALEDLLYPSR